MGALRASADNSSAGSACSHAAQSCSERRKSVPMADLASSAPPAHGPCRAAVLLVALIAATSSLARADAADATTDLLPTPFRLEQALQLARERRAEITAAKARARALAQRPAIVSALDDPMISPSLDHLPFMLHGADVSLAVEQRFPLSGVLGNRRRVAEAEALRGGAEADKIALDVELDAASSFLMLDERREMALILAAQQGLAKQLVRAATARYAAGTGIQADVLRAEIEIARLDGARRATAAEVRAAEIMLNTSLGRPALAPLPSLDSSVTLPSPPEAASIRQAALEGRPELRMGNAEVSRAQAEVAVMQSMYGPMAMVRTGPAYTMTDGPGWMLMVGVSIPLWRTRLHAGSAEAAAMVDMAQADLVSMRRMVEGEALSSREQLLGARARFLALRDEIIPLAEHAIEPTVTGYSSGQLPLVSVLEAAQALWSAQGELVMARFELGMNWARLHRAMGDK